MNLAELMEKGLPCSPDAERSVLGAILLDNDTIKQAETLMVGHFSLDSHRKIYAVMIEMWGEGIGIDAVTLSELMRTRRDTHGTPLLESVGGVAYIASLTDGVPPRANIEHYVKILHDKKQLRDIIAQSVKAMTRAYSQTDKPAEILEDLNIASVAIAADTTVKDQDIFLDVSKFIRQYNEDVVWRVEGAIEVGTNGTMIGMSGDAKSPAARALAVCLASGLPWLDMRVLRCRTALVSREDYAGTTSRFIRRFIKGNGLDEQRLDLAHWLWVNSRAQLPSLLLDNPADLRLLINNLKRRDIQFCILDVLNVLHSKDENDNSEMRKVLRAIDHIRDEVGCQVMVLHHSRKGVESNTSIAESGRGSSAIAGFAEFKIRIRTEDEENGIRHIQFKTKAGEGQKGFYWQLRDTAHDEVVIERKLDYSPGQKNSNQKRMPI